MELYRITEREREREREILKILLRILRYYKVIVLLCLDRDRVRVTYLCIHIGS